MSTVDIRYDGVDITPDVIISSCRFVGTAKGSPGRSKIRVRDDGHGHSFITGKEITLDIDGLRHWGGFLTNVKRGFFSNGTDKSPAELERYFELEAVDYNVLFQRRVLYDKVDETKMQLTTYPPDTHDDAILLDYIDDHLDLTDDGLGTSLIEHVGTPSTDSKISGAAGWTWDQLMRFLTRNTGAIYYIDPDKEIALTDVDTPDAPFLITDNPDPSVGGGGGGTLFADDFARVVAGGIGNPSIYQNGSNDADASVDGDTLIVDDDEDFTNWDFFGGPVSPWAVYQYDFWVPAVDGSFLPFFELDTALEDGGVGARFATYLAVNATDDGMTWEVYARQSQTTFVSASFVPDRSAWYTAKLELDSNGAIARVKAWKRGEAESDWMAEGALAGDSSSGWVPELYVTTAAAIEPAKLDNILISELGGGTGASEVGCRELEIDDGGEQLRNDALAWGIGQGSTSPVFQRVQDQDSIDLHRRWQVAATSQVVWRQATIDRIADSYVYGSPQNKRGGKDDAVAVRCAIFEPGIRAGMKVPIRSDVWGFEDVLPAREVAITFPSPTRPRYDLVLSHEIDAPWSTFEFWFPSFALPDFDFDFDLDLPDIDLPPWDPCFESPDVIGVGFFAVSGWQKGPPGGGFPVSPLAFTGPRTVENVFDSTVAGVDGYDGAYGWRTGAWAAPFEVLLGFTIDRMNPNVDPDAPPFVDFTEGGDFQLHFAGDADPNDPPSDGSVIAFVAEWNPAGSVGNPPPNNFARLAGGSGADDEIEFEWEEGTAYWVRICYEEDGRARAKVWRTIDSEPGSWMLDVSKTPLSGRAAIALGDIVIDAGTPDPTNKVTIWSLRYTQSEGCVGIGGVDIDLFGGADADVLGRTSDIGIDWTGDSGGTVDDGHAVWVGGPDPGANQTGHYLEDINLALPVTIQVRVRHEGSTGNGGFALGLTSADFGTYGEFQFGLGPGLVTDLQVAAELEGGGAVVDNEPNVGTHGVDNIVKIEFATNGVNAKVWEATEPEPNDWQATAIESLTPLLTANWLYLVVQPGENGNIISLDYIISEGGSPCFGSEIGELQDPPNDGPNGGEALTEISTPSGEDPTSTWFQTRHRFYAGSQRVFLNGFFLRPGIDYVPHPTERWIEVLSSVTINPGDDLTATYTIFLGVE